MRLPSAKAAQWLIQILWALAGIVCTHASHPLDTIHRRQPDHGAVTQLLPMGSNAVALFGDASGRVLEISDRNEHRWLETGLSGIDLLAGSPGGWVARARDGVWRSTQWPQWTESNWTAPKPPAAVRRLDDRFYAWTSEYWESPSPLEKKEFHRPRLYVSDDGSNWSEVNFAAAGTDVFSISDVSVAGGIYFITGYAVTTGGGLGGMWTSQDGLNWKANSDVSGPCFGIAYGNGRWLAGGTNGWYALSTNGAEWTQHQHSFITGYLTNWSDSAVPVYSDLLRPVWVQSGFHCLVQDSSGLPMVVASSDGIRWHSSRESGYSEFPQSVPVSVFSPSYGELTAINDQAWLWGADVTVWQSDDWRWGATRVLPVEPGDFLAAAASRERVIALMANGRVARSDDGVQWQFGSLPGGGQPTAVTWAEDRGEFMAAGYLDDVLWVWKSADGERWGQRQVTGHAIPVCLVRGNGHFVMATTGRMLFRSTDGVDWEAVHLASPEEIQDLEFGGGRFVAIDRLGSLLISADGKEWNRYRGPGAYQTSWSLEFGDGLWVVQGGGQSFVSENLLQWSQSNWSGPAATTFEQGEFIGAEGDRIASSSDGMTWWTRSNSFGTPVGNSEARLTVAFKNSLLCFGPNGSIHQSGVWRDFVGDWKSQVFSTEELGVNAVSGDTADPDGDGLDNLLEYALNLNPRTADAEGAVVLSAEPWLAPDAAPSFLVRAVLPNQPWAPGVRVFAETSTDLTHWRRDRHQSHADWSFTGSEWRPAITFTRISAEPSSYMRIRANRAAPAPTAP